MDGAVGRGVCARVGLCVGGVTGCGTWVGGLDGKISVGTPLGVLVGNGTGTSIVGDIVGRGVTAGLGRGDGAILGKLMDIDPTKRPITSSRKAASCSVVDVE